MSRLINSPYNMKLPGTYAAYAAIMTVFGQTASGIHVGLMLVNGATIILVFLLAEKLFGSLAGLVAGTTYAMLSILPQSWDLLVTPRTSSPT